MSYTFTDSDLTGTNIERALLAILRAGYEAGFNVSPAEQMLWFDGVADTAVLAQVIDPNSTEFSFFALINFPELPASDGTIFSQHEGVGNNGRLSFRLKTTGELELFKGGGGTTVVTSTQTLSAGKTYLVGFTDSGGDCTLFLDGASDGNDTLISGFSNVASRLGAISSSANFFNGWIKPLCALNYVLTSDEIAFRYASKVWVEASDKTSAYVFDLSTNQWYNNANPSFAFDTFTATSTGFQATSTITSPYARLAYNTGSIKPRKGTRIYVEGTLTLNSGTSSGQFKLCAYNDQTPTNGALTLPAGGGAFSGYVTSDVDLEAAGGTISLSRQAGVVSDWDFEISFDVIRIEGATLDLHPQLNGNSYQLIDRSANKNHALITTGGEDPIYTNQHLGLSVLNEQVTSSTSSQRDVLNTANAVITENSRIDHVIIESDLAEWVELWADPGDGTADVQITSRFTLTANDPADLPMLETIPKLTTNHSLYFKFASATSKTYNYTIGVNKIK